MPEVEERIAHLAQVLASPAPADRDDAALAHTLSMLQQLRAELTRR